MSLISKAASITFDVNSSSVTLTQNSTKARYKIKSSKVNGIQLETLAPHKEAITQLFSSIMSRDEISKLFLHPETSQCSLSVSNQQIDLKGTMLKVASNTGAQEEVAKPEQIILKHDSSSVLQLFKGSLSDKTEKLSEEHAPASPKEEQIKKNESVKIVERDDLDYFQWKEILKRAASKKNQEKLFICASTNEKQFSVMTEKEIAEKTFKKLSIKQIKHISRYTLRQSSLLQSVSQKVFEKNVKIISKHVRKIEHDNRTHVKAFLRIALKVLAYVIAFITMPLFGLGYLLYKKTKSFDNADLISNDKKSVAEETRKAHVDKLIQNRATPLIEELVISFGNKENVAMILRIIQEQFLEDYTTCHLLQNKENRPSYVGQFERDAIRGIKYIRYDKAQGIKDARPIIATKQGELGVAEFAEPMKELMISKTDKENNRWEIALQTVVNQTVQNALFNGIKGGFASGLADHMFTDNDIDYALELAPPQGMPTIHLGIKRDSENNIKSFNVSVLGVLSLNEKVVSGLNPPPPKAIIPKCITGHIGFTIDFDEENKLRVSNYSLKFKNYLKKN